MKQCPYCGTMLYDNAVVCNICGFNYQYYYYQQQMYQMQMYQQQLYQQQIAQRQAIQRNQYNQQQKQPQTFVPQSFQQLPNPQPFQQYGYYQNSQQPNNTSHSKTIPILTYLRQKIPKIKRDSETNEENKLSGKKVFGALGTLVMIFLLVVWVFAPVDFSDKGGKGKASDEETAVSIVISSQVTVSGQHTTGRTVGQMLMTMFSDVDTRVRFNEDKSKAVVSFSGYYSVAPGVPPITFGVIEYTVDMKSKTCWVSSDDNNISVLYYSVF